MSEQEKQENQKTIVAFAAGLLIGGLLVWIFGGATKTEKVADDQTNGSAQSTQLATTSDQGSSTSTITNTNTSGATIAQPKAVLKTGEGKVSVSDQKAGSVVTLESATFPSDEGWIGVRDYANGQMGSILGVARFSKEQGLVPEVVDLQRATKAGDSYAIVFYSENGDRVFKLADDAQVGGILATFTAK